MDKALLEATAAALVAPGKGILAADESNGTMSNRLEAVGLESSEEARRAYRANLFTTPGCESAVSGVILYDETIRQNMDDGTPIPKYLTSRGIIPGIKVDTGAKKWPGLFDSDETVTEGLDGLRERCAEYFSMGARFAKWRAVIKINENEGLPTVSCLHANAHALARYAAICQEQGLVPIIEPEVLMSGDHTSGVCDAVTTEILQRTWEQCHIMDVHLPGTLLKPNMILPGDSHGPQIDESEGCVVEYDRVNAASVTLGCLLDNVPPTVGGIVFLSGGQSDIEATEHLNLMNDGSASPPWELSYSYGRALQAAALKAWAEEGAGASQAAFAHRAKMNSLARSGDWDISLESR